MVAWSAKTLTMACPYTMRTAFRRIANIADVDMIKASTHSTIRWLSMEGAHDMPKRGSGMLQHQKR